MNRHLDWKITGFTFTKSCDKQNSNLKFIKVLRCCKYSIAFYTMQYWNSRIVIELIETQSLDELIERIKTSVARPLSFCFFHTQRHQAVTAEYKCLIYAAS